MADANSGGGRGLGWFPFDLLGQPVPPNKGLVGRPQHAATAENLEIAMGLYAEGHSDGDVAAALGISVPTLRAKYFSSPELKRLRRHARMVVKGKVLHALFKAIEAGKVGAIDKVLKRLDKADLSAASERIKARGKVEPKAPVLGKKEAARKEAKELGGLYATRTPPPGLMN